MIVIVAIISTSIALYNYPFFLVVKIICSSLLADLMIMIQYCCLYSQYCTLDLKVLFTTHCRFVPLNTCVAPILISPGKRFILWFLQVWLFKIPHIK